MTTGAARCLDAIRERQPRTEVDVAYHVQDKSALDRLLVGLQGLEPRPACPVFSWWLPTLR